MAAAVTPAELSDAQLVKLAEVAEDSQATLTLDEENDLLAKRVIGRATFEIDGERVVKRALTARGVMTLAWSDDDE